MASKLATWENRGTRVGIRQWSVHLPGPGLCPSNAPSCQKWSLQRRPMQIEMQWLCLATYLLTINARRVRHPDITILPNLPSSTHDMVRKIASQESFPPQFRRSTGVLRPVKPAQPTPSSKVDPPAYHTRSRASRTASFSSTASARSERESTREATPSANIQIPDADISNSTQLAEATWLCGSGESASETSSQDNDEEMSDSDASSTTAGTGTDGTITPKQKYAQLDEDTASCSSEATVTAYAIQDMQDDMMWEEETVNDSAPSSHLGISACPVFDTESELNEYIGDSETEEPEFSGCEFCQHYLENLASFMQDFSDYSHPLLSTPTKQLKEAHDVEHCPLRPPTSSTLAPQRGWATSSHYTYNTLPALEPPSQQDVQALNDIFDFENGSDASPPPEYESQTVYATYQKVQRPKVIVQDGFPSALESPLVPALSTPSIFYHPPAYCA